MTVKRKVKRGAPTRTTVKKEARPNRVSLAESRNILTVLNKEKDRHYRWVNDHLGGQRMHTMLQRGYRVETSKTLEVGDYVESESVGDGAPIKKFVGVDKDGSALYAYLMSIPMELHAEDQAYLADEVDAIEDSIMNPDFDPEDDDRDADYAKNEHGLRSVAHTVRGVRKGKRR